MKQLRRFEPARLPSGRPPASARGGVRARSGPPPAQLRVLGNRATQGLLRAKLLMDAPGNAAEREAHAVADAAMRHSRQPKPRSPVVQRDCGCDGNGSSSSETGPAVAPPEVTAALSGPGRPMEPATRADMESRLGQDFSDVRIHTDAASARSADAVRAQAYTVGSHVVFGGGRYTPAAAAGRRLLAHELVHVTQQQDSGIARNGPTAPPLGPRVTPEIRQGLVVELDRARRAAPGFAQNIPREYRRTFAVAAIITPDGSYRYESAYFDRKGDPHAEPALLAKIASQVRAGDMVAIAIDQAPCGPESRDCQSVLQQFKGDPEHGSLRVYTVHAESAAGGSTVGSKTAITRPIEDRFLIERLEFRRVRLPIYGQSSGSGPAATPPVSPTPAPAPAATSLPTTDKSADLATPPEPTRPAPPKAPSVAPGSGRIRLRAAAGAAGTFAAGLAAGLLAGAVIDAETKRRMAVDAEKLAPQIEARMNELSAEAAARRAEQPGSEVFLTVSIVTEYRGEMDPGAHGPGWGSALYQGMTLESAVLTNDRRDSAERPLRDQWGIGVVTQRRQLTQSLPLDVDPMTPAELAAYRETQRVKAAADDPQTYAHRVAPGGSPAGYAQLITSAIIERSVNKYGIRNAYQVLDRLWMVDMLRTMMLVRDQGMLDALGTYAQIRDAGFARVALARLAVDLRTSGQPTTEAQRADLARTFGALGLPTQQRTEILQFLDQP